MSDWYYEVVVNSSQYDPLVKALKRDIERLKDDLARFANEDYEALHPRDRIIPQKRDFMIGKHRNDLKSLEDLLMDLEKQDADLWESTKNAII